MTPWNEKDAEQVAAHLAYTLLKDNSEWIDFNEQFTARATPEQVEAAYTALLDRLRAEAGD